MLNYRSISTKLTWMNLTVSAAALLLACLGFLAYDRSTARESLVASLSTQAQIIASNSISALVFNDPQSAQNTLSALRDSPNIEGAGLLTPDGRIFAEYWKDPDNRATVIRTLNPGENEFHVIGSKHVVLIRRIVFQGKDLGSIFIRSDLSQISARMDHFIRLILLVLGVSLAAALIASRIIGRAVARPIMHLANVARTVSKDKNYSLRAVPIGDRDELDTLIFAFNDMLSEIQQRDAALIAARDQLEMRVDQRTAELKAANRELEAFSYSVSHDLRGPLETIGSMSYIVQKSQGDKLDTEGKESLSMIRAAADRMAQLIDDMLNLARVSKAELHREQIDVTAMAKEIASELRARDPQRQVEFRISDHMAVAADPRLMRIVMDNLIGNAWKYTSGRNRAIIEVGMRVSDGRRSIFVRDNGAGFDPRGTGRLFQPFQRLHPATEFPGTGIGLATVQRIVQRHGGEVTAEGAVGAGATFSFMLP